MVYYRSLAEINAAYQHIVGKFDALDPTNRPDGHTALQLAALQPGESVLDLGTGCGRLLADAKLVVGAGVCVGVDAVRDFLYVDLPFTLSSKGLTVYPQGTATQQVHRLHVNVTDGALRNQIRGLPGTPQLYDCIFALHLFTTIPADQRLQLLRTLRRLLSSTGRLILNMSARFTDSPPAAAEVSFPLQFRSTHHTEAPGCELLLSYKEDLPVLLPLGVITSFKHVVTAMQLSPNRLWTIAEQQATQAATRAGFTVSASRHIGKGDNFDLVSHPDHHSPSLNALSQMSVLQIGQFANSLSIVGAYSCIGRALEVACVKETEGWVNMSLEDRDFTLAVFLQQVHASDVAKYNNGIASGRISFPKNVAIQALEATQVGVLVVLRRA